MESESPMDRLCLMGKRFESARKLGDTYTELLFLLNNLKIRKVVRFSRVQ